jgi:hypothetical protein
MSGANPVICSRNTGTTATLKTNIPCFGLVLNPLIRKIIVSFLRGHPSTHSVNPFKNFFCVLLGLIHDLRAASRYGPSCGVSLNPSKRGVTMTKKCGTCKYWQRESYLGAMDSFCRWEAPPLPFWAYISNGNNGDYTFENEGSRCETWQEVKPDARETARPVLADGCSRD